MGVFFKWQGEVVWDPSPRLARLFLAQVRALENAVELQSGIGEVVADEVEINPLLLSPFVSALMNELDSETSNATKTLFAGPFSISHGILLACEPGSTSPMRGDTERLARRGQLLVSGQS
ncbi:DUF6086 family protein, partial [Corallococcus sp. AB032C]|uniref:DUF6086 family protein n=1 Tax=Corallococcus sp. AB032C TaxID=2316717 RepID=UPI0011C391F1